MLKIGVLRGRENSFPEAIVEYINSLKQGVSAEFIQLGGTSMGEPNPYRVILDRISHEVPYYQVYLKQASLQGTYVLNNPFWMNVDDKFFGYSLAQKLGIPTPKTVVLPNYENIPDITAGSLRNLWPIDFEARCRELGFPIYMKPAFGGGWKNVKKVESVQEAIDFYLESGKLTMMMQEGIEWDDYIRCLCIGSKYTRPIRYTPRPFLQGEYHSDLTLVDPKMAKKAEEYSKLFNSVIGYDMNAMEFAVKDGVCYAIDITNYVCDMDYVSLKDAHFPWAVETMAKYLIELAKSGAVNKPTADWSKVKALALPPQKPAASKPAASKPAASKPAPAKAAPKREKVRV